MDNKTFGSQLKKNRIFAKKTVAEVSEYLTAKGYKASEKTIYSWESGRSQPSPDALLDLCRFYGIDDVLHAFGYKFTESNQRKARKNTAPKADTAANITNRYKQLDEHGKLVVCAVITEEERRLQTLPNPEMEAKVIHLHWNDQPASAGTGFDLHEEHMVSWLVRYNELTRKADFCLNVKGHSMEPKFYDGDEVLVREQPSVDIGEIGLFVVDGNGYIKKQGIDRLISLNPDFDDIFPNEFSDVRCVGKIIGVLDPQWIISR